MAQEKPEWLIENATFSNDPFKATLKSNTFMQPVIPFFEKKIMLLCDGGPKKNNLEMNKALIKKQKNSLTTIDIYIQDKEYAQTLASAIYLTYGKLKQCTVSYTQEHVTINKISYHATITLSGPKLIVDFFHNECANHQSDIFFLLRQLNIYGKKDSTEQDREYDHLINKSKKVTITTAINSSSPLLPKDENDEDCCSCSIM